MGYASVLLNLTKKGITPLRKVAGESIQFVNKKGNVTTLLFDNSGKVKNWTKLLDNGNMQVVDVSKKYKPISLLYDKFGKVKTWTRLEPNKGLKTTYENVMDDSFNRVSEIKKFENNIPIETKTIIGEKETDFLGSRFKSHSVSTENHLTGEVSHKVNPIKPANEVEVIGFEKPSEKFNDPFSIQTNDPFRSSDPLNPYGQNQYNNPYDELQRQLDNDMLAYAATQDLMNNHGGMSGFGDDLFNLGF